LATQQIIAYETGAAATADPLGGSYYVETLTSRIEHETMEILNKIDAMGGTLAAMRRKWFDREIEKEALRYQRDIEEKRRVIVGINEFQAPEEQFSGQRHKYSYEAEQKHIDNVRKLKRIRDIGRVRASIDKLREEAIKGKKNNLIPSIIEAVRTYATTDEIIGTIRESFGYSYDPFEIQKSPF
jgi:methylmalonyl-CoA mutase N-terminal domain/subunit